MVDEYKIKREVLDELDDVLQEVTIAPKMKALVEKKKKAPTADSSSETSEDETFNKLFGI